MTAFALPLGSQRSPDNDSGNTSKSEPHAHTAPWWQLVCEIFQNFAELLTERCCCISAPKELLFGEKGFCETT